MFSQQIKSSSNILVLILGLVCFFYFARSVYRTPYSPDSYLHEGVGRFIAEERRIPTHRDISFKSSQPSLEWVAHSWLYDLITYLTVASYLRTAVSTFLLLTFISSLILWREVCRLLEIPHAIIMSLLPLSMILGSIFWRIHPITIAIPLLLSIYGCYLRWRKGGWEIVFLPVCMWLYSNLAGGLLYLLVGLLFLIFCSEFILIPLSTKIEPKLKSLSKGSKKGLIGTVILGFLATLIHPLGIRVYLASFTEFFLLGPSKWYGTLPGILEVATTNVFKNAPSATLYSLFLMYCLVLLSLCLYLLLRERARYFEKTICALAPLPFLFFAFWHIRYIPAATFLTLPLCAISLQFFSEKKPRLSSFLLLFSALLSSGFFLMNPKGLVANPPVFQCSVIKNLRIPPNLLSSSDIVGYLYFCLYPQKQQIDLRDGLFDESDSISLYGQFEALSDASVESQLSEFSINSVLISKENDYQLSYFNANPNFSLLYFDYSGFLFVRNDAVSPELLEREAIQAIDLSRNLGTNPDTIPKAIRELEQFTNKYPHNVLALGQLASLYRFEKENEKANSLLQRVPQELWNASLYTELGRLRASQAKCSEAESAFLRALEYRKEEDVSRTVFDLALVYAGCFQNKSKAKHYFQRYLSYPIPETERQRAIAIAKRFLISLEDEK